MRHESTIGKKTEPDQQSLCVRNTEFESLCVYDKRLATWVGLDAGSAVALVGLCGRTVGYHLFGTCT